MIEQDAHAAVYGTDYAIASAPPAGACVRAYRPRAAEHTVLHQVVQTHEAVEFATLAWVDWFNTRRLLEPIGHVPPSEYEDAYYRSQKIVETPVMGAGVN